MKIEDKNVRLPLTALVDILERDGIHIDVALRLKLQKVLDAFTTDISSQKVEDLKYYIRPLVAKSQNEQLLFDRAFERYTQNIQSKILGKEEPPLPRKNYWPTILFSLATIAFLVLSSLMYLKRQPPSISLLKPPSWIALNDTLVIEGNITGMLTATYISVDGDRLSERESYFKYSENDLITAKKKFKEAGTHKIELRAHNIFAKKTDTLQAATIEVCDRKPVVKFNVLIDPGNPLEVRLIPQITNIDSTRSFSARFFITNGAETIMDSQVVATDTLFYKFNASATYSVELTASYDTNASDGVSSICDITSTRDLVSVNSVILGDKKALITADENKDATDELRATQNIIIDFNEFNTQVLDVVFSPDGQTILTGLFDNTARLWDLNGTAVGKVMEHSSFITAVLFSPDGKTILTSSNEGRTRLWDLSGELFLEIAHTIAIAEIVFSPDSQLVLVAEDNSVRLWDLNGKNIADMEHDDAVHTIAFSPDGNTILTGSEDGNVRFWDLSGNLIQTKLLEDPSPVYEIVFSPNGQKIVVLTSDDIVYLWDSTGNLIQKIEPGAAVWKVAFSQDGQSILTIVDQEEGETLLQWDLEGNLIKNILEKPSAEGPNTFSPDGIILSPDRQTFLTTSPADNQTGDIVRLWDLNGDPIGSIMEHQSAINDAIFSNDGRMILTVTRDETVGLWDVYSSEKESDLRVGVISYKDSVSTYQTYETIFNSLARKIDPNKKAIVTLYNENDLTDGLRQGTIDIGIFTVLPYLETTRNYPELTAFATHKINDNKSYEGYIVTRQNSGINNLGDLEGKDFTYVKETSTSGYTIPNEIFKIRGVELSETDFSGSHQQSITLLKQDGTQGIVIDEARWKAAGSDTIGLKIIRKFKVPYQAYVFSSRLGQKEKGLIESALVDFNEFDQNNALDIEKLSLANDGQYNEIRTYLNVPRRKPALVLSPINAYSLMWSDKNDPSRLMWSGQNDIDSFTQRLNLKINESGRFAHREDSTQFIYRAKLNLENKDDKNIQYTIYLNEKYVVTGNVLRDSLESKFPELFMGVILSEFPIETDLFGDPFDTELFIRYGTNDGLNTTDYIYTYDDKIIDNNNIIQDSLVTKFVNLDASNLEKSRKVKITYPSEVNKALYFNIWRPYSWQRSMSENGFVWIMILLFLVLLAPVLLEIFYFRKRKTIPSQEVQSGLQFEGLTHPYDLELRDHNGTISPEKKLYDLSRLLKHRREAGTIKIDIKESIKQTSQNAGFAKLQFKETTKIPEYLVVVDRSNAQGFQLELFGFLNDFLINEDTFLDVFYFNNSLQKLKNEGHPNGISLEALSEKYPDHALIVISDGKTLVDPNLDRVHNWATEILPKWDNRFILTPRSYSEWDQNETLIDTLIPVLPASLNGLSYVSECLINDDIPSLKKRISDLKLERKTSFHSLSNIEGIKQFLDNKVLFQWFCCLAIYPKLDWQFVLTIGKALAEKYKGSDTALELNYESLFKISEVSHLLDSEMDDDLRVELLKSLDSKVELIARQAILDVLNELDIPKKSFIYREVMVQSKINYSLLHQDDKEATKDLFYLWENNLIQDRATKRYLAGSSSNPLNEKAEDFFAPVNDRSFRSFIYPRGLLYLCFIPLIVGILNFTVFQNIIQPKDTELAYTEESTLINYTAFLNNRAVSSYNSGDFKVADSLLMAASRRELTVAEVQYNRDVIKFNNAMKNYRDREFTAVIDSLSGFEVDDSLRPSVLHHLGLSHFYLNESFQAQRYLDSIENDSSDFFDQFPVSLKTLIGGQGTGQETVSDTALQGDDTLDQEPTLCDKYSGYTRSSWQNAFRLRYVELQFNVVVATFREKDGATLEDAIKRQDQLNAKHPNLYFDVYTDYLNGSGEDLYFVVLARGISDKAEADEIAQFANECGIVANAYVIIGFKADDEEETCTGNLNVQLFDASSNQLLNKAFVSIIDSSDDVRGQRDFTNSQGRVSFSSLDCQDYILRAALEGYQSLEGPVSIPKDAELKLYLEPIEDDLMQMINLQPIYFDFDKFNIRPDAEIELSKVLSLMTRYPEVRIRVEAHMDSRGDDIYNQRLSERMATSARDWLIDRGIDPARLEAVGYGETRLVNKCANDVACSEEEHQLNRRAVFIVIDQ